MLVSDIPEFQRHVQTTDQVLDKTSVEYWAKYTERLMFKHALEYINKLDKAKESYTILWLTNLNIAVKTKTAYKEFPYRSKDN